MNRALRTLVLGLALAFAGVPAWAQVTVPPPPPPEPKGWIGISYDTEKIQDGLRVRGLSRVVGVVEGSPASGAGIHVGDILVSVNGRTWEEQYATKGAPAIRAGEPVHLVVERDGRLQEIHLVAGKWPDQTVEEAGLLKVTMMPDSIADRLYIAMDSLRIRMLEDGGLRFRVAELEMAADSIMEELARERVVRIRRAAPGAVVTVTPFAAPRPAPKEAPSPFTVWVMADSVRDSLKVTLERNIPFRWSTGASDSALVVFRPTVPYVLGENRVAGAEVVDLRPELAEYFHVHGGVLVVDVVSGTPAAKAGIQAGDVLTHMDGALLRSTADLRRGLGRATDESTVTLVRQSRTLEVRLRR